MIIIPVIALSLVFGIAAYGLILDWRDNLEADHLAAMEAARRERRERIRAAAADPVTMTAGEVRSFARIAERAEAEFPPDLAERIQAEIKRGAREHDH